MVVKTRWGNALEKSQLIVRTADKRLSAPWEKVVAEINLAA
jgi:hypothetical protein